MTAETSERGSERREYYRKPGIIYLLIEKSTADLPAKETPPAVIDQVTLRLMNFRQRLEYTSPPQKEYFEQLCEIMEMFHHNVMEELDEGKKTPRSRRQSVVISGSGMDFLSDESFSPEERILCHMTFTVYPYATLRLKSRVIRVLPYGQDGTRHRVCVNFEEVPENDRELLIRFVNELERRQRIQQNDGVGKP